MTLEDEIFQRKKVNWESLVSFGFVLKDSEYDYRTTFMNDDFEAHIHIHSDGSVSGKVYDTETGDEYSNIRVKSARGAFVMQVREEYQKILQNIADSCFISKYFVSEQANRMTQFINEKYGTVPEFLWERTPSDGIFRHSENQKWYGLIMNIPYERLNKERQGMVEVLNVKIDLAEREMLLMNEGCYPAYHMNKKHWMTVVLDDTLTDQEIITYVESSYENTK
ncbi:MAG TPA: MmcQ/YjbR family DNA-binding protein [Candidatus Pelethosoma merdigallinarum]|nr:MmcQ/YjbR family DNA-binding protein [Candidatus Pelethosoma merdigallinarum]